MDTEKEIELYLNIKIVISKNDLESFKSLNRINKLNINKYPYNPLILACQYEAWDIAEYIISISTVWTNKTDKEGNTALTFALNKSKIDFATMLLDYGFNNFNQRNNKGSLAMNYISDRSLIPQHLLDRILSKSIIRTLPDKSFKIYEESDLSLIDTNFSGSFGNLFYDSNTMNMVKVSKSLSAINSLIKEMIILKMINSINPHLSATLKGIYIKDEDEIGLVLESLTYSLKDVFSIYSGIDVTNKFLYFKSIFTSLLDKIDKIHNMGILHRDLKPGNIMIDTEGHIRIIDFGLAEYVGIKNKMLPFTGTLNYMAPDSKSILNLRVKLEQIKLAANKRNYSSDIFSFGNIIIYALFQESFSLLFNEGEIYYYKQTTSNRNIKIHILEEDKREIINKFSPHLMDLLKLIFEHDSNIRLTAKELLLHEFFTGIPRNFTTITFENTYITTLDGQTFSNDEIRLDRGVLKYGQEIYDFVKEQTIPVTNITDEEIEMLNLNLTFPIYLDFDSVFNRNIILSSIDYNLSQTLPQFLFERDSILSKDTFISTLKGAIPHLDKILMLSISSLVEYYCVRLQKEGFKSSIISYVKTYCLDRFYDYSLSRRDIEVKVEDIMNIFISEVSSDKDILLPIY